MLNKRTLIVTLVIAIGLCTVGYGGYLLSQYLFYTQTPQEISTVIPSATLPSPEVAKGTHPLTGLPFPSNASPLIRPFAVVIDNAPEARPQYGLSKADLVYETLTEGGVTRLLALYSSQQPLQIGPIRSARPYLIRQAQDWDAAFIHSGGSKLALDILKNGMQGIINLDEFSNGNAFVRTSQTPPHNLFTSSLALETLVRQKEVSLEFTTLPSWAFSADVPDGPTTTSLTIPYNLPSMVVAYRYNETTNAFDRSMGGMPHRDAATNVQLSPANVILEFRDLVDIPDPKILGLIDFSYAGAGDALIFTKGRRINARWTRSSNGPTVYATVTGRTVLLTPGQTFIEVIPTTLREEALKTLQ
ncbi:MAG: DUF3048 domain-containing protein [Patescibacteria group bacterium]